LSTGTASTHYALAGICIRERLQHLVLKLVQGLDTPDFWRSLAEPSVERIPNHTTTKIFSSAYYGARRNTSDKAVSQTLGEVAPFSMIAITSSSLKPYSVVAYERKEPQKAKLLTLNHWDWLSFCKSSGAFWAV
jgi:hypothetical protein